MADPKVPPRVAPMGHKRAIPMVFCLVDLKAPKSGILSVLRMVTHWAALTAGWGPMKAAQMDKMWVAQKGMLVLVSVLQREFWSAHQKVARLAHHSVDLTVAPRELQKVHLTAAPKALHSEHQ